MSVITEVLNTIIAKLKDINGLPSPYSTDYMFKKDINRNAIRGLKFIDEINDYPSIYLIKTGQKRIYNTNGVTQIIILCTIICYVKEDYTQQALSDLIKDVEHVIYNLTFPSEYQVQDVTIEKVDTDQGLLIPYGMAELSLAISLERI